MAYNPSTCLIVPPKVADLLRAIGFIEGTHFVASPDPDNDPRLPRRVPSRPS